MNHVMDVRMNMKSFPSNAVMKVRAEPPKLLTTVSWSWHRGIKIEGMSIKVV